MSMDLEVWSIGEFDLPPQLPSADRWQQFDDEFAFDGGVWQVLVLSEPSEPSSSVSQLLPGATHVAYVTLEPIGAGPDGYDFLEKVVRTLARESLGVWVDPNGSAYRHDEGNFG